MSTELQPRAYLLAMLERSHRLMVNDLKAIPAEELLTSPGGCARSALNMVAECAAFNGFVAEYLSTGAATRLSPEQRAAHLASFDTRDKALDYLAGSVAAMTEAIQGLDESTLGEESDKPFGRPMSRFALAGMPAGHMVYHDGQLTYIQTLHGDAENHWN